VADEPAPAFRAAWQVFIRLPRARRLMWAVGLGTAAFSMQDILLEPYGGQILHLPVGSTSALTALTAWGALCAFALAARRLQQGADPVRLAALGALVGLAAFAAVIFANPLGLPIVFYAGAVLIGLGGGLFAVCTLTEAMGLDLQAATGDNHATGLGHGIALGAYGAVQATAMGASVALGGGLRDLVGALVDHGALGGALDSPVTGYGTVYGLEILLLFATLVALGPLARRRAAAQPAATAPKFGLAEFPG
jgi:BCD family chlorophyll transporter-like MFS transporter